MVDARQQPIQKFSSPRPSIGRRSAACADGSFRQAAGALLLRQSTLSLCIRQLGRSIGMIVFEQLSGSVRTKRLFEESIRTVRSIVIEQMNALVTSAHGIRRGEARGLAIGFRPLPS
jgi:DNA-binding transcriptional LysR family regulator